jgi:hypothetical protein
MEDAMTATVWKRCGSAYAFAREKARRSLRNVLARQDIVDRRIVLARQDIVDRRIVLARQLRLGLNKRVTKNKR